jgi:hypothetical protein
MNRMLIFKSWTKKLYNQFCGFGRIRKFLSDTDPELEVWDPDPASVTELDFKIQA